MLPIIKRFQFNRARQEVNSNMVHSVEAGVSDSISRFSNVDRSALSVDEPINCITCRVGSSPGVQVIGL